MPIPGALAARILDEPDDLAACAVLGDALTLAGEPRGELVAIQLALARLHVATARDLALGPLDARDPEYARTAALLRRANVLLAEHRARWEAELALPPTATATFARGSASGLRIATLDVDAIARALATAPIVDLAIAQASADELARLARLPAISRLRGLAIDLAWADDAAAVHALVAAAPRLERLALAGAHLDPAIARTRPNLVELDCITPRGAGFDRLALPALRRLVVHHRGGDGPVTALAALAGRFPRATSIEIHADALDGEDIVVPAFRDLPARLAIHGLDARYLPSGPALATVRDLTLDTVGLDEIGWLADNATHLADLTHLDLGQQGLADLAGLAALPLPRLATLALGGRELDPTQLAAVVAAFPLRDLTLWCLERQHDVPDALTTAHGLVRFACEPLRVGDAGLRAIAAAMPALRSLDVNDWSITDASVLRDRDALVELQIAGNYLIEIDALSRTLPNLVSLFADPPARRSRSLLGEGLRTATPRDGVLVFCDLALHREATPLTAHARLLAQLIYRLCDDHRILACTGVVFATDRAAAAAAIPFGFIYDEHTMEITIPPRRYP